MSAQRFCTVILPSLLIAIMILVAKYGLPTKESFRSPASTESFHCSKDGYQFHEVGGMVANSCKVAGELEIYSRDQKEWYFCCERK